MRIRSRHAAATMGLLLLASHALIARGEGARLFKSGPIQITADGARVWTANRDNDSVTRIDTATGDVVEHELPDPAAPDSPRGLAVTEDGATVWVACHDSDVVHVLSGNDGSLVESIELPWGSGPHSIAISPSQRRAVVTLHRAAAVAVLDVSSREVERILDPLPDSPLGVAWAEGGDTVWVTHLFAEEEHPFLTRIDFSGSAPRVTTKLTAFATDPRQSSRLQSPHDIAEGGYLTFRGHLAQIPASSGRNELWIPTQYNNITEDTYSPDSTVQSSVRHVDLSARRLLDTNDDKVILTAVHTHDPQSQAYVGPGWDARVAGPVDIAFSKDGAIAYVLHELSNDLVVMPAQTPAIRPAGAEPLVEIGVGERPLGVVVSPTSPTAWVLNSLSRDVSVVDLEKRIEVRRIPVTPETGEPYPPDILRGAKIFHTSADPRISRNEKIACGSCHPDGEHDGRFWSFHRLPGRHGNRATMSLLGLSLSMGPRDPATGWGQLHRSGDRDEVQDFEHNFQGPQMGGTGFLGAGIQPELGPPNAGRSSDLDALAEYVLSLSPLMRSPFRGADGSLSEAAVRGATFFLGADRASRPADAGCAKCHVPETAFTDRKFHDVGDRIFSRNEQELDARSPAWHVNTPSLVGVFATRPYSGAADFQGIMTMLSLLGDQVARARSSRPHGHPDGLTGRQLEDLAEFVLSIDGNMSAGEVRGARDTSPPRMVRAEPASLTSIVVWFNESVDRASAERPGNWRLERLDGTPVPIASATRDGASGDRVTLGVELEGGVRYRLIAGAGIEDMADSASGGVANRLDPSDGANTRPIEIGETLTVTLGASGHEHISVAVHDAAMIGPGLATWGHDSIWLFNVNGGPGFNTGFVRFDWARRFRDVTGLESADDILAASISLFPERGDAQEVEIRRVLRPWSDPATGTDFNSNPAGGPTWRAHSHPSGQWNQAGAGRLGGTGGQLSDYGGSFDLAAAVDARVVLDAINERTELAGVRVTEAFRFWFDNPQVDHGYAVRLRKQSSLRFERAEHELGRHGPVLSITYRVPAGEKKKFIRADCNDDGTLDVSDAVCALRWLFLGASTPPCLAALDVDADGTITITDPIAALEFLFAAGLPPAAPFPDCGSVDGAGPPCESNAARCTR